MPARDHANYAADPYASHANATFRHAPDESDAADGWSVAAYDDDVAVAHAGADGRPLPQPHWPQL